MLAIAIDSSLDMCDLALGTESEFIAEYRFFSKMSLLRRIVPNAEKLLEDAGHKVQDLNGVIISLGPGSFTGLRIGVTVAKSLAYTLGVPIVGVGTLDAIARSVVPTRTDLVCPLIYARPGEVYWSLFDSSGKCRLAEPAAANLEDVMRLLKERGGCIYFCGTGATRNADEIRQHFGAEALIGESWSRFPRGAALLEMGLKRLTEDDVDDCDTLTPLYVKKPTPVVRLEAGDLNRNKA